MANYVDETVTFGKIAKRQSHYGTTSKPVSPSDPFSNKSTEPEIFAKHLVQVGDTLQGVAVKYGVTIEQLKRVNSLWTNDSLFLREYLLIPVPSDCQHDPDHGPSDGSGDLVSSSDDATPQFSSSARPGRFGTTCASPQHRGKLTHSRSEGCRSPGGELSPSPPSLSSSGDSADPNRVNINDYFSKYDAVLTKLKHDAMKLGTNSRLQEEIP